MKKFKFKWKDGKCNIISESDSTAKVVFRFIYGILWRDDATMWSEVSCEEIQPGDRELVPTFTEKNVYDNEYTLTETRKAVFKTA
jgi:hypothetical protein